jgi:hypothetical protein
MNRFSYDAAMIPYSGGSQGSRTEDTNTLIEVGNSIDLIGNYRNREYAIRANLGPGKTTDSFSTHTQKYFIGMGCQVKKKILYTISNDLCKFFIPVRETYIIPKLFFNAATFS